MGAIVLDASVVIGFFDPLDAHHPATRQEIASARRHGDDFILPASVLCESMVGTYRHSSAGAELRLQRTLGLFGPARDIDDDVALEAARLRARHASLRLPDALVIATGIVDDAAVLTCDARWAAVDARVQVVASD